MKKVCLLAGALLLCASSALAYVVSSPYVVFSKAQKVMGVYGGETSLGQVTLKTSKYNSRGEVKVSGSIKILGGKTISLKSTTIYPYGDEFYCEWYVRGVGEVYLEGWVSEEDGGIGYYGAVYGEDGSESWFSSCSMGGDLSSQFSPGDSLYLDLGEFSFEDPDPSYWTIDWKLPGEIYGFSGNKFLTGAVPSVSAYVPRMGEDIPMTIDAYFKGFMDDAKPNVAGLRLSYNAKTGLLKGSFKVYTTNLGNVNGRHRLKKNNITLWGLLHGCADGIQCVSTYKIKGTQYSYSAWIIPWYGDEWDW